MSQNGEAISAAKLRATHARLRVDRLRVALRGGTVDAERVARELPEWLQLFRDIRDGAFRVLVLELLSGFRGDEVDDLLWEASEDRADGVRLEALRILCDRFPGDIPRLADRHAADENLEVRVLLATRMHGRDRSRAESMFLEILRSEARGPKERQALERVLGFFVEDVQAQHLLPTLQEMREAFDDPENFFGWAAEKLSARSQEED
jgi:hypothetical protein